MKPENIDKDELYHQYRLAYSRYLMEYAKLTKEWPEDLWSRGKDYCCELIGMVELLGEMGVLDEVQARRECICITANFYPICPEEMKMYAIDVDEIENQNDIAQLIIGLCAALKKKSEKQIERMAAGKNGEQAESEAVSGYFLFVEPETPVTTERVRPSGSAVRNWYH